VVFVKKRAVEFLGDFHNHGIESFLAFAESEAELRELIEYLILHREQLKELALSRLFRISGRQRLP
jgi:hypothetical protein